MPPDAGKCRDYSRRRAGEDPLSGPSSQEYVRKTLLELERHTGVNGSRLGLRVVDRNSILDLGLAIGSAGVDRRTLGKRVDVTDSDTVVLNVSARLITAFDSGVTRFAVNVVETSRQVAAGNRNDRAEVSTPALEALAVRPRSS